MRTELKDRFKKLLDLLNNDTDDRKEQIKEFIKFVFNNTSFTTAPCSTKFHLNCEEGLFEHSLNVIENLLKIKNVLEPSISDTTCILIGLFHDLGKAGDKDNPYYIPNEPTPNQKKYGYDAYPPFTVNKDLQPYMEVPDRSLYLIATYAGFKLTPEEYQAIRIHDGLYTEGNRPYSNQECPLALLLHFADCWSGLVLEEVVIKDWRK